MSNDRLRLALVTRRYPPLIGGAEKMLSYLGPALADAGADVDVLTASVPGMHLPREERQAPHFRVVRLATVRARFVGTWLYMRSLKRILEHESYDLAYVSMLKHDAFVAVGVGRKRGFPVILRPEGAGKTGDLAWQRWGRFGMTIGRRCRLADAIISISPAIRSELEAAQYDPQRIHDVPNGVAVPGEPWQPRPGWSQAPCGVFVGRLAPEKDLVTLIAAWPQVQAGRPEARLGLVGDGPERPRLAQQIEELGLQRAVELAGSVDDAMPWLRRADLFVLPSREEGMSMALLEAMALGLPIVATAIPGNRGLLENGVHGRLVPPGEPGLLAQAILAQWADWDRAVAMGRAARTRVEKEFSIATVAARHMELFRKLVRDRARP